MKIGEICQIGIVVSDLQKAVDNYWATLGIGPWSIVRGEPPLLRDLTMRGKPVEASVLAAFAQSGSTELELIEPLEGPSIWKEFLEERGGGLHHVQSLVQDPDVVLAAFKEMGVEVLMSGRIGDNIFYYMDTEPLLGVIYEFVGPDGAGKTTTMKTFTDLIGGTEGKAYINGIPVHEDKRRALAHVVDPGHVSWL